MLENVLDNTGKYASEVATNNESVDILGLGTVDQMRSLNVNEKMSLNMAEEDEKRKSEMQNVRIYINSLYYENNFLLQDKSLPEVSEMLTNRRAYASRRGVSSELLCFVYIDKDFKQFKGLSKNGRFVLTNSSTIPNIPTSTSTLITISEIIREGETTELQKLFNDVEMSLEIGDNDDILIYPNCIASRAQLAWNTIYENEDIDQVMKENAERAARNNAIRNKNKNAVENETELPTEVSTGINDINIQYTAPEKIEKEEVPEEYTSERFNEEIGTEE